MKLIRQGKNNLIPLSYPYRFCITDLFLYFCSPALKTLKFLHFIGQKIAQ